MLGFGLQILLQPAELWNMAREITPPAMVYFEPGEAKDCPIRSELTVVVLYLCRVGQWLLVKAGSL